MFLFGFGMASVAKAQQKMSNPCTSKSRNLELHFTMSVFLLAASLDFQLYWRALPSFPVLANTGIYVYIYILVWTRAYPCTEQSSAECSGSEHSATETSFCEQRSRTARSKSLFERTGGTEAGSNSLFERTGGTGQARTALEFAQVAQAAQAVQVAQVL